MNNFTSDCSMSLIITPIQGYFRDVFTDGFRHIAVVFRPVGALFLHKFAPSSLINKTYHLLNTTYEKYCLHDIT